MSKKKKSNTEESVVDPTADTPKQTPKSELKETKYSAEQYSFLFEELSNKIVSDDVATMINTLSITTDTDIDTNRVGFFSLLMVYDTLEQLGIHQPKNSKFGVLKSQQGLLDGLREEVTEALAKYAEAVDAFKQDMQERRKREMAEQLASMQAQQDMENITKGEA